MCRQMNMHIYIYMYVCIPGLCCVGLIVCLFVGVLVYCNPKRLKCQVAGYIYVGIFIYMHTGYSMFYLGNYCYGLGGYS